MPARGTHIHVQQSSVYHVCVCGPVTRVVHACMRRSHPCRTSMDVPYRKALESGLQLIIARPRFRLDLASLGSDLGVSVSSSRVCLPWSRLTAWLAAAHVRPQRPLRKPS